MQAGKFVFQRWDDVKTEEAKDLFIIDGLVSSRSTLIYGEPKAGKSLITAGIVASLATGEALLDREVDQPAGGWRPLVCWTDDGGASEYKTRIEASVGEEDPGVQFVGLPGMDRSDWHELYGHVIGTGCNIIVFDVLSQLISGDLNSGPDVAVTLDGIRQFTRSNIPVIMVAHSSEKGGQGGKSDKPLGHTSISGGFRWRVMVTKSKTGTWTLKADGNRGDNHSITFRGPEFDSPRFEVGSEKDGGQLREEATKRSRARSEETLSKGADIAQFLHGKDVSQNEAGRLVAKQFGGSPKAHANRLGQNGYPVRRTEGGVWKSTLAA